MNTINKELTKEFKKLISFTSENNMKESERLNEINSSLYKVITKNIESLVHSDSIDIIIKELENYDDNTYTHSVRVSVLAVAIGKLLGFSNDRLAELALAGLLHDIGKLFIPVSIINKPSRLDDIERAIINSHTAYGAYYIKQNFHQLSDEVMYGVYEHHEKLDGTGYPNRLVGNEISLFGRILAIADIFEAYSSARSYHEARTIEETIDFMKSVNGLDQEILRLFLKRIDIKTGTIKF